MIRKSLVCLTSFLLVISAAVSQQPNADIRVQVINGKTGKPWKLSNFELTWDVAFSRGPSGDLGFQTDSNGIAIVSVPKRSTIHIQPTDQYDQCDARKGAARKGEQGTLDWDFRVSQIASTGVVQQVAKPTHCRVITATSVPGELIVFMRPTTFFERHPIVSYEPPF